MKIEVIIGKNENSKGRVFTNLKEATFFIEYNEVMAKCHLNQLLGEMVDNEVKYPNELKRMVYLNHKGERRYYILKIVN